MKAHQSISLLLALALLPIGPSFAGMNDSAEADPIRSESDESDLLWGASRDVISILRRTDAERVGRRYEEGDTVEEIVRLRPLPKDILPALNPFSELDLHFVLSKGEASVVLPRTRRVLKVYKADAPEAEIIDARAPAPGKPPSTQPAPQTAAAAQEPEARVEEGRPARDRPQSNAPSRAQPQAQPKSDAIRLLLERAEARRKIGDILGTRQFLEHASKLGSTEAIFRLAQTYDGRVLATWGARGVQPDEARAKQLYSDAELIAGIGAKGSVRAENRRD